VTVRARGVPLTSQVTPAAGFNTCRNLRNNLLTRIGPDMLSGLSSLHSIFLQDNELERFGNESFRGTPNLQIMYGRACQNPLA